MPSSLVTGGCGFIGSHLVEALVARGERVRVLDNLSSGVEDNLAAVRHQVELIRGSVTDAALTRQAAQGQEVIYHLAALPSVAQSLLDPLTCHEVCATGTLHILEAARQAGVRRVVYAASSSAYGNLPGRLRREDDPVSPLSPYAAAKLAGENYCRCFTQAYGLETVCLRFFNIFGPRQDANSPYAGVIARFVQAMLRGEPPHIYGDGQQSRDFTYVADAVQALLKAAVAPAAAGRIYNIGSGQDITLLQLVEELNQLLGTRLAPLHEPPRPGDVRHSQADISRARQELGYEPAISFREGLCRTLAAFSS